MNFPSFEIIDISQPVNSQTACFPGDTPFGHEVMVSYQQSGVMNLTAFRMSPHVGTHADAPVHIGGNITQPGGGTESVAQLDLKLFLGPVAVVDVSPCAGPIGWEQVEDQLLAYPAFPPRILFKTRQTLRYTVFEDDYAWLSVSLIETLAQRNACLVGLDTPSVDAVDSKTLETHHALLQANMVWLENLDLSQVHVRREVPELYFLSALPLKLTELEASPVRAVLLRFT
ncbi:cyclase family protein [Vampirovibrio chlorellavorus]|uniref:cyclase family protein n=1 Tax=Vampirovibrio chlorellavorus TaxID=758823 RepID=UPI0026E9E240|nr:cyclase family protein [Vampirovibrio chlorellavorus]